MVNRAIFAGSSRAGAVETNPADSVNEAGGLSYTPEPEEALAQLALTGTFSNTYYANADAQTAKLHQLAKACDASFVAKTAIYARQNGLMKDTPVFLLAHLFSLSPAKVGGEKFRKKFLSAAFRGIVQDTKALRNFASIIRSGVVGRKSFGTTAKNLMREFLVDVKTPKDLYYGSIGDKPTLGDVVKMVRPKAKSKDQNAVFRWLIGKDPENPPDFLAKWIAWKKEPTAELPEAPFEMLTGEAGKNAELWHQIAMKATFNQTRQTLKAYKRNGVVFDNELKKYIVATLTNEDKIKKARVFPYALMTSAEAAKSDGLPNEIYEALLKALDFSLQNVPELQGNTWVFVDTSGSMSSPVTGTRKGQSTVVQCREVAALYAAALASRSPDRTFVVPFNDSAPQVLAVRQGGINTYMEMYEKLSKWGSGGTNCSAPMATMLSGMAQVGLPSTVIYLSDNESWIDHQAYGRATATLEKWRLVKAAVPAARLVCIDLQPHVGRQVPNMDDVLNIGGFSNSVFDLVSMFANGELDKSRMRSNIEAVNL